MQILWLYQCYNFKLAPNIGDLEKCLEINIITHNKEYYL